MTISVNGVALYYEADGQGPPLILLHGNGESRKIFRPAVQLLKERFTVYAIDSRGHGRSSKNQKPLHYADMAEDIAQFIQELELRKPALYGFSDGGVIGLLLAAKYPDMLSRLAVSGVNLTPGDLAPWFRYYARLTRFITRSDRMRLMLEEPNITAEDLALITVPTLLLAGEKDIIKEEHTRFAAACIPGAEARIMPGENHASYVLDGEK
ncbi:MAG: alpha/beta hydrolase, partial [Oscillospiraceae bacterium]|nr:alpha/beta hydrolase [Oscillospiraceae bacterium]